MTQETAGHVTEPLQRPHFDVAMRGYERGQVDEHIAKLQREMKQLATNLRQERDFARNGSKQLAAERDHALQQLQGAQQELEALRAAGHGKDHVSLFGDRLHNILATAEQEANAAKAEAQQAAEQTIAEAKQQADSMMAEVLQEADTLLTKAKQEAEALRAEAKRDTDALRASTKQETDRLRAEARQETDSLRAEAKRETDDLRARVTKETDDLRAKAENETATLRAVAKEETETLRATTKQETDRLRAEAKEETDTLRATTKQETDTLLAQARKEAADTTARANAEADRIVTSARNEAEATVGAARREESEVRSSLEELVQRREQVRRELTTIVTAIESLIGKAGSATVPAAADLTVPLTPVGATVGAATGPSVETKGLNGTAPKPKQSDEAPAR